jgi:hypothetical protein
MRAGALLLGTVLVIGCSGSVGDETGDPDSMPASDTSDATAETAVDDADDATVSDSGPGDSPSGKDADATATDTPVDAMGAECDGFSTKALVPPTTCDKAGGLTSSEKPPNGLFSTSYFGCYRKTDGTIYKDPSDNCLFACGNMGLCAAGKTGPECEADLKWFSADADRFGCGGRIRVTNCKNGKRVVLAALDKGPNCPIEKKFGAAVLDMSYPAMTYLFDGKTYGGSELQRVHVVPVAATTPLGPL